MRILHVVSVMDVGGMETFIMNLYRHIDRETFQFDFLVHHKRRGVYEDEIEALGGRVYHFSLMDDFNLPRYRHDLRRFFDEHTEYRVVHGHLGSPAYFYLGEAARHGVEGRILHSHIAAYEHTLKGVIKNFLFRFSPKYANIRYACSKPAGEYQFGSRPFEVIPNGIDVARFRFSPENRLAVRKEMGIGDRFVIGHVGRFNIQKNHAYLLEVFGAFLKIVPDAVLLLLGQGERFESIRQQARQLGIEDSVIFMGVRSDINRYYSAMDAFAMPSFSEALPLTCIEAQCSSLPCLLSEGISQETKRSEKVRFLPIGQENIEKWTDALKDIYEQPEDRSVIEHGVEAFDIKAVTRFMEARYAEIQRSRQ